METSEYGTYTEAPVEKAPVPTEPPSVEDHAAHDYQLLLTEMRKQLEEFPGEQLKRVMMGIAEYPFEKQEIRFSYPNEKRLFAVFAKLLDCKFVLMRAVLEMKKDEIDKLLAEQQTAELKAGLGPSPAPVTPEAVPNVVSS